MPLFRPSDFGRLCSLAAQGRVAPIYIFTGPEEEAAQKARQILSPLLTGGALYHSLDLEEGEWSEALDFLLEQGLFGTRKILLLKKAERLTHQGHEKLVQTLLEKTTPQGPHAFLVASSFPKEHPLYQYAQEKGVILPLEVLKGREKFLLELSQRLSEAGKKMGRTEAEYFLSLLGEDYLRFQNELEKLLCYVGERELITKEDIEEMVSPEEEASVYLLGDTLLEKGPEGARSLFQRLIDAGFHPWFNLLPTLFRFFERLWLLQFLEKRDSDLAQAPRFESYRSLFKEALRKTWDKPPATLERLHPYAAFRLRRHLNRISEELWPEIFFRLWKLEVDLRVKFRSPLTAYYQFFVDLYFLLHKGGFSVPEEAESFFPDLEDLST